MAVQGLNRLNAPNTATPAATPEREVTTIEVIPNRDEARRFGEHTLRYERNIQEMGRITESRNAELNHALDKLDQSTQRLINANLGTTHSPYRPSPTLFGRHRHRQ